MIRLFDAVLGRHLRKCFCFSHPTFYMIMLMTRLEIWGCPLKQTHIQILYNLNRSNLIKPTLDMGQSVHSFDNCRNHTWRNWICVERCGENFRTNNPCVWFSWSGHLDVVLECFGWLWGVLLDIVGFKL
jgi:hypothetical protein